LSYLFLVGSIRRKIIDYKSFSSFSPDFRADPRHFRGDNGERRQRANPSFETVVVAVQRGTITLQFTVHIPYVSKKFLVK
jgi:hypothetical protein